MTLVMINPCHLVTTFKDIVNDLTAFMKYLQIFHGYNKITSNYLKYYLITEMPEKTIGIE